MAYELWIRANTGGATYHLNQINKWLLTRYDGLGIANVRRLYQTSPFQEGDTDLGFRRDPRYITLGWALQGCNPSDLYDLRRTLMGIFRPRDGDETQLVFHLPNGRRLASDVNLVNVLDFTTADRLDGKTWNVSCVLKASDPRLYDPQEKELEFTFVDLIDGWDVTSDSTDSWVDDFGWDINDSESIGSGWNIGESRLTASLEVNYAFGQLNADIEYPVITIYGPIDSPIIKNNTTNEKIDLSNNGGLILGAGEYVVIDLRFGRKSIIKNGIEDVSSYLTTDSDLVSWHLSYNTELLYNGSRSTGFNAIEVSVDGLLVTADTRITISYYDRFVGV